MPAVAGFIGACALLAAGASPAAGAGGSAGGGAGYVTKPVVRKVTCVRACASRRRPQVGSVLRLSGRSLGGVRKVVFMGSFGRRDDVVARPRPAGSRRLRVRVPVGAVSGPLAVVSAPRVRSRASRSVPILPPPPPEPNVTLSPLPGARGIETGTSRTRAFYGARRTIVFSYRIAAPSPVSLKVQLVSGRDGSVVQTWTPPAAPPGQVQSVAWNGTAAGLPAPPGRYFFRLAVAGGQGVVARPAQAIDLQRDAFDLYDHIFPIRRRHNYGGAGAHFGAGRGRRGHQGHDVFARCGARLVAARGGVVKAKAYHRAAGNYLVIDGAGTDVDYAYMHLAEPSAFARGDRVYTGQRLGSVGETGNARGCHLHFEMWGAPGWYEGGRPFDPLSSLRAWDSWS